MNNNVICLNPDMSILETAQIFLENKIDGAPVVENDKIVGLFTKTHLIRALANEMDTQRPVSDLMTHGVKVLDPNMDIRDVEIMYTGRYPVVENGKMIGFITKSDIMIALNEIIDDISGQLETVINSVYNPVIAIDKDGIIRIWNRAIEKYSDMDRSMVLGQHINKVIPESALQDIIRSGQSEYGIKIKIGDNSFITNRAPIIKNGEISGAVAVLYDISELEKVTRELEYVKSLNKELDAIIDSSFDGLYITDGKGLTLRINRAIKRMTGLGEEDLVNKTMYELVDKGILSRSASVLVLDQKNRLQLH